MKTHTAFLEHERGEREKKGVFQEQQNIQLKTGCCTSKTLLFLYFYLRNFLADEAASSWIEDPSCVQCDKCAFFKVHLEYVL